MENLRLNIEKRANDMILNKGVYPTMITPYTKDCKIDYEGVEKLVDFYIKNECDGIFAVCQSSEMLFLSLKERVELAKATLTAAKKAPYKMNVVASGHCADDLDAQIEEINAIYETGVDAFVLVSNRFDIHNDGDDEWIKNAEYVLGKISSDIPLGIYECPRPYKRLLTPRILEWCKSTGRFKFIKDTCCDPVMLTERLKQLDGSGIMLFNANGQTLLHSLREGGAGYSGIMANYYPDLIVWLCRNFESSKADDLSNVLSMCAFTENAVYPCTAKYYLGFEGVDINTYARSADQKTLTEYQKLVMKQMFDLTQKMRKDIGL